MNRIVFLGTGGGRTVMFTQLRHTGGIYIELDGHSFIVDPGPGSLYHARRLGLKIEKLDAVLLSHRHVDHATDVNAYLDGLENSTLIAESTCLTGDENDSPAISRYHQKSVKHVVSVESGKEILMGSVSIRATPARHTAPTVGFVFSGSRKIGYTSDTVLYNGLENHYEGLDILIANVLVPYGKIPHILKHSSIDDLISMLNRMKSKPRLVVITHFSMWMLQNRPSEQAKIVQNKTGIKTIAAKDDMEIDIDRLHRHDESLFKFS